VIVLAHLVVGLLLPLGVYWAWDHHVTPPLTGDEPAYALIATSLARDHTLNLAKAATDPKGVASLYQGQFTTYGQAGDYRHDGRLASVHAPGLGLLLAPAARVRFGLTSMRLTMVLITALLAWQLAGVLRDLLPEHRLARWLAWAGTCFSMPLLAFSNQIYPEVPAALCLVVAARLLARGRGRVWPAVLASGCAAALPWLNVRFGLLGLGVVGLAIWSVAWPRQRACEPRGHVAEASVAVAAPFVVSVLALMVCFQHLYGSPFPWAPYRSSVVPLPSQGWLQTYAVGLGTWLSPTSGVVPFGPFAVIGLLGLGPAWRRFGRVGGCALALGLAYAFAVVPLGFFGYSLPGRFAVVLIPFVGLAAACLLVRWRALVPAAVALLLVSVAIIATHRGPSSYGSMYDQGRVTALTRTASLWPVTAQGGGVETFAFTAASGYQGIGVLAPGGTLLTVPAGAGPGRIFVSPDFTIRKGRYDVGVALREAGPPQVPGVTMSLVEASTGRTLDQRRFSVADLDKTSVRSMLTAPGEELVRFVIGSPGAAQVDFGGAQGQYAGGGPPRSAPISREVWKGLLWVVALGGGSVLLARRGRDAHRTTGRPRLAEVGAA
jgi:hypothetical protein